MNVSLGYAPAVAFAVTIAPFLVPPKKKVHFVLQTSAPFRAERLVVPDAVGKSFAVAEIVIGTESQLFGGPVPAAAFCENAIGIAMAMDSIEKEATMIDLVIMNTTSEPRPFTAFLFGTRGAEEFQLDEAPAAGDRYHAWAQERQRVYESLHRGDDEVTVFNNQEILADTFLPISNMWWVDDDGYKQRPVYHFENVQPGDKRSGQQAVDITTYEGFE